MYMTIACC